MKDKASSRYYQLDGEDIWRVNYYLIQLLSVHGYICKYLYKMGKMSRPNYVYAMRRLMIRNTLPFIVRYGDWKECILRPNSVPILSRTSAIWSWAPRKIGTAWPITLRPYWNLRYSIWMREVGWTIRQLLRYFWAIRKRIWILRSQMNKRTPLISSEVDKRSPKEERMMDEGPTHGG